MISVLLCTYNREKYLARAIESVINQTYKEWELIIVDDGSTDGSLKVIESYDDSRIRYICLEDNNYYCYAANKGLKHCKGDYVAIINSDDEWITDKLEKQVKFLDANTEYGACFTSVTLVDNNNRDITDKCPGMRDLFAKKYGTQEECMDFFLHHGNSLCHPSALIRQSILEKVGGFNLMFFQLADFDLWVRIVTEAPVYVMRERLIRFRMDVDEQDQVSSPTSEHMVRSFNEQMIIRRQMIERLTDEQFIRFFRKEFRNPFSKTHLEIEFEKAFLLMECMAEAPELKVLGLQKIEEILRHESAVEVLKDHFQLSVHDIYEWDKQHQYIDYMVRDRLKNQEEKLTVQEEEIENLKALIKEYETSTSWRCTAPLRKIMRKVRGNA